MVIVVGKGGSCRCGGNSRSFISGSCGVCGVSCHSLGSSSCRRGGSNGCNCWSGGAGYGSGLVVVVVTAVMMVVEVVLLMEVIVLVVVVVFGNG